MTDPYADGYVQSRTSVQPSQKKERLWLNYGGDSSDPSAKAAQILGAPDHGLSDATSWPLTYGELNDSEAPEQRPLREKRRAESTSTSTSTVKAAEAPDGHTTISKLSAQGSGDEDRFDKLDEIAAPAPVDEAAAKRETHLEDRGHTNGFTQEKTDDLQPVYSRQVTELYTIAYLILFSLFGTLARVGLQALTFYPGAPVQTGLLWANVSGSFIMGFLSEDRMLFQRGWGRHHADPNRQKQDIAAIAADHVKVKKTIPLYIGLATGFCGSFTSFSSFLRDAFFAMANALPVPINHPSTTIPPSPISQTLNVPRNGGYSFMALLAVAITTIGLSLGALLLGGHLALALGKWTPSISLSFYRRYLEPGIVVLAFGCWLAAIIMAAMPPDRPGGTTGAQTWAQETWRGDILFALVFAPLGCLLRFYVSLHLNDKIKSFPLGTFTVNIVGTVLEAIFIDLQHVPSGGRVGCQVLQGMNDGFCGCLTTVSTWVAEIKGLRLRHAYVYAGVSFLVGLLAFILITGSFMWTHGFAPLACAT